MPISASFPTSSSTPTSKKKCLCNGSTFSTCADYPGRATLNSDVAFPKYNFATVVGSGLTIQLGHISTPGMEETPSYEPACAEMQTKRRDSEGPHSTHFAHSMARDATNVSLIFPFDFTLLANCKSFGPCLSVPNNKIDETVVWVFRRLPGCWFHKQDTTTSLGSRFTGTPAPFFLPVQRRGGFCGERGTGHAPP